MTTTLAHIDDLRDVFDSIAQDCLMLDLTPCTVQVTVTASGGFDAMVQMSGNDQRSADALADSWNCPPGRLIGDDRMTYIRSGRFDLNGRSVAARVVTGHPGGPLVPADYKPQAVEA